MQGKTVFYQFTYQPENVTGRILVNGFVLCEIKNDDGGGSAPLNVWLTGDNELKVELKKADPSKPAQFMFGVAELRQGDTASTADKGKLVSAELKNSDFKADGKASAEKKFKSSIDFKQHLNEAGQAKESDVLAYAQKVYALFEKKDVEGILRESEIKVNDYSKAFGGIDMKSELKRVLTEDYFKAKLNKLSPGAMRAVAEGPTKNIWHVFNGNDELITAQDSGGSTLSLPVYIGLIDGKLKIVR